MANRIEVSRLGPCLHAQFRREPDGCIDFASMGALDAICASVEADRDINCVIFSGSVPGVFIKHYDVAEIAGMLGRPDNPGIGEMHRILARVETLPVVTLAAIDGLCMGGGLEFALCCDVRWASASSRFGFPEINIGIFPGAGGTQRFPRAVGEHRALELILTGRIFDAREAAAIGAVHRVIDGDVVDVARRFAESLSNKPPATARAIKALVRGAVSKPLEAGIAHEAALFNALLHCEADRIKPLAEAYLFQRASGG